jgi:hypothetical protein
MPNPNHSQKTKRVKNPACAEGVPGHHCCATAILSAQPDFKAQRSRLEEAVEGAGHIALFYPKFHCEMNWIEYYWGACKKYARKHCTYTLPGISLPRSIALAPLHAIQTNVFALTGLREVVPKALESVKPSLIFKYWRRTQRIIQAYRDGAVFGDKEYKERVYKSHRRTSQRQPGADSVGTTGAAA